MMNNKKKMKWISGGLIGLVIAFFILIAASVYMFNYSLKTNVTPTDKQDSYAYLLKRDYLKQWIDSLQTHDALRDTCILAPDGVSLHAIYVRAPKPTDRTALLIHGYTDNAIRMLMIGHIFHHNLGYNILLPDLRGQGESKSDYIQMGWKDRLDVIRWIDVCKDLYGANIQMAIHGISMGGATTMMLSGDALRSNVKCLIDDCGYTSVWDEFAYQLKQQFGLPPFPLLYATSIYCDLKLGWNFKEASALEQVEKCHLPMLFIHGDADDYVPTWMVYQLYDAKPGEKELWVLPGVGHANAYWDYTEDYENKISEFVGKYIQ